MITASHNPKYDNGYKVYWENGCQINPPHDSGIAASIEKHLEPKTWDTSCIDDGHLLVESAIGQVEDAYFRAVRYISVPDRRSIEDCDLSKQSIPPDSDLRFVYTPMHGIGLPYMTRAIKDLGLEKNMVVVRSQAEPDPEFPTVRFPNPEEHGALDEAKATADANGINFILSSDPDADRFAAAEKVDGQWHQYTGNQVGILLASHVLETFPPKERSQLAMLTTTVSSRMLAVMAERESFHYAETLTGFRWLGNKALDLRAQGFKPAFAFEEALGYMLPRVHHDKDSVSAATMWLVAVDRWQRLQGLTPWQKLQQLYQKYGYFEDANTYVRSPSPDTTNAVFKAIRALGDPYPQTLGGRKILQWRDLTEGYDSATENHVPELPVSKSTQMITCELEGNVRFTVRGSGTEPKIKLYIECSADSTEAAKKGASDMAKAVIAEWFRPDQFGLEVPS
jgi:phosphoglucomutase